MPIACIQSCRIAAANQKNFRRNNIYVSIIIYIMYNVLHLQMRVEHDQAVFL